MIQKSTAVLSLLFIFAACDKTRDTERPAADQETTSPGRTRVERSPSEARETRGAREARDTDDSLRTALRAAKDLEPGEERNNTLTEVALQALASSPDLAEQAIAELPPGHAAKQALIESYLRMLLSQEKEKQAKAWANSLDNDQDRAFATATLASLLTGASPEQTLAELPPTSFAAEEVDPAAEQALQNWVATDPAGAAAWATRLPAGEARDAGYQALFSHWINTNAQGALAWAASQTHEVIRSEAVTAIAGVFNQMPDPARDEFLKSADPELRAEIEQEIAKGEAPPSAE